MSNLQVWHGNRLVGHITGGITSRGRRIELRQFLRVIDPDNDVAAEEDVVQLPLGERSYEMDCFAMKSMDQSTIDHQLAYHGVPPDCPFEKLPHKDALRYYWIAADASTELYERLFDFDCFEPEAINGLFLETNEGSQRNQLYNGGYVAPPLQPATVAALSALQTQVRRLSSGQGIRPGPWSYYAGIKVMRPEHSLLNIALT